MANVAPWGLLRRGYSPSMPTDEEMADLNPDPIQQSVNLDASFQPAPVQVSDIAPSYTQGAQDKQLHKDTFEELRNILSKGTQKKSISPEEVANARKIVDGMDEFKNQQSQIDTMRQQAAEAARKMEGSGDDAWLRPLIALTDSQTGSNLMAGYAPKFSQKDKMALMLKYQDELAKRENDLSNEKRKTIMGLLGNTSGFQNTDGTKTINITQDPNFGKNPATSINQFMKTTQSESKDVRSNDEELQKIMVAVNSGNSAEQAGVPMMIARMIEHARPAMAAASMEQGDRSFWEKLSQTAERLKTGKLTPKNVAEYSAFINDMKHVNELAKIALVKRWKAAGSAMGIDDSTINGLVPPEWLDPFAAQSAEWAKPKTKKTTKEPTGGDPGMDAFLKSIGK